MYPHVVGDKGTTFVDDQLPAPSTHNKNFTMKTTAVCSSAVKAYIGRALRETGAALKNRGEMEVSWMTKLENRESTRRPDREHNCRSDFIKIFLTVLQIFARHRPSMIFGIHKPFQTNDTFIAPSASVIGNVTNWDQSSVWYKAVVRADAGHAITIGFSSSIGEGSVLTTLGPDEELETTWAPETYVGHYTVIGSGCILKSCRVDDLVIVGDKCTILEGALVENHVVLEPGTVVMPYQRIPSGQKWGGNPAAFIADLTPSEKEGIQGKAQAIRLVAKEHEEELLPYGYSYVHLEQIEKSAIQG